MVHSESSAESHADSSVTDFLKRDYELKVRYLSDQFTRMWNRFNYFLVLESGLFAVFAAFLREEKTNDVAQSSLIGALILISVCWYVFGAQDKYLVEIYRKQIEYILFEMFQGKSLPNGIPFFNDRVTCADNGKVTTRELNYPNTGGTNPGPGCTVDRTLLQWRSERLSITKLAAAFPALLTIVWLIVFLVLLAT